MRRDCFYDGKLLNISERIVVDGIDLRIFCYIFVYSRRRTERRNRTHAAVPFPERSGTLDSGDIGNTSGLAGVQRLGRKVLQDGDCYNRERPHQALDMKYPAELYQAHRGRIAPARSLTTPSMTEPSPSPTADASASGTQNQSQYRSSAGRKNGREGKGVADKIRLVSFADYDLGSSITRPVRSWKISTTLLP